MEKISNSDNDSSEKLNTRKGKIKNNTKTIKILFIIISVLILISIICISNLNNQSDESLSPNVEQTANSENPSSAEDDNSQIINENTTNAQTNDNNNSENNGNSNDNSNEKNVDNDKEEDKTITPLSGLGEIFSNANAMVMGDSTAEGLSAYQILYENNVVWTRGRVIQYMEADLDKVLNNQPAILFLSYGANDLLSWNGNVDGYIGAYEKVIKDLRELLPNTRICINAILPVSQHALDNNPAYAYRDEFNARLKEFCEENDILFIDNEFILYENGNENNFEGDGVHPRPFYYRLWATNMAKAAGIA